MTSCGLIAAIQLSATSGYAYANGPPDWFNACQSHNSTVLTHCCNNTHVTGCNLRIMRKPNGTVTDDVHAARFAVNRSWSLSYEYQVPMHQPTTKEQGSTYYIWGDTDFDSYGLAPRAQYPMSKYIYNQIVPQLVLGDALASNDANFTPGWRMFDRWAVQAQYYWSSCTKTQGRRCAPGHARSFAQCGAAVNVSAGDVIKTRITYDPSNGSITASIGAAGAETGSTVRLDRPFPNEDPPLWRSWRDFFEAAQARSQHKVGPGVLNHADFNIETHQVPPAELCKLCPFRLSQTAAQGELGQPLVWWDTEQFNGTSFSDVACARSCLAL